MPSIKKNQIGLSTIQLNIAWLRKSGTMFLRKGFASVGTRHKEVYTTKLSVACKKLFWKNYRTRKRILVTENPSKKSCRLLSSSFPQKVLLGRCFPVNFVKFEHLQGTVPYSDNIYAAHKIIPWYDIKRELRM